MGKTKEGKRGKKGKKGKGVRKAEREGKGRETRPPSQFKFMATPLLIPCS